MSETSTSKTTTPSEDVRAVVSRVLSLSVFFVGIGVFAVVGFALHQIAMFAEFQLTYFAVGVVVGIVGILLWILTR